VNADAECILAGLSAVRLERERRAGRPDLARAVIAVKAYQHARFAHTYADLMAEPRYARAAEFFLNDLYGPADFTDRDAQFARIVPALVRLFPRDIVGTVSELAQLHSLSEGLDSRMGGAWLESQPSRPCPPLCAGADYGRLWRQVGGVDERERQIVLMGSVGAALDRYTRNPLLRQSLRLMRGPASAAGLGALQRFLENGFDTFRGMRGAEIFLSTVGTRERTLARVLFAGGDAPDVVLSGPVGRDGPA
jgi:hypothetical protein